MPKWFVPACVVCAVMFAATPFVIANAPFESTMGLVYKIFYYHMPSAWMFLVSAVVCGVASARYLAHRAPLLPRWRADERNGLVYGLFALVCVVVQLFGFEWLPDWPRVLAVLGAGIALVLAFALGASLPLLRARPARTLRSL